MGTYRTLFDIFSEHNYFSDGLCKTFDFIPTTQTGKLMKKTGVIFRQGINFISLLYDDNLKDALLLYLDDPFDHLAFSFRVYPRDISFLNYTDLPILSEKSILYFDNRDIKNNSNKKILLNRDKHVSEKDIKPIDSYPINEILSERHRRAKPLFIVNISSQGKRSCFFNDRDDIEPRQYVLKFRTRPTFWNYYLLGNIRNEKLFIADTEQKIEFDPPEEVSLPENRSALVFRSRSTIPLLEKSDISFQLKEHNSGKGKMLIKRLPVASSSHIFREIDDSTGEEKVVSEIFINF